MVRYWLALVQIFTTVAASWFNFALGWKFNWRLMLDVMVHKEVSAQFNSSSIGQDDGNSTTDGNVSLLDLMLKLNSGQQKVV
uniref:Uncharacterized protein n=1 Tax=Anopheles quadriannulatus TaxID=34691 RepID=A0A182XK44_ANOQN